MTWWSELSKGQWPTPLQHHYPSQIRIQIWSKTLCVSMRFLSIGIVRQQTAQTVYIVTIVSTATSTKHQKALSNSPQLNRVVSLLTSKTVHHLSLLRIRLGSEWWHWKGWSQTPWLQTILKTNTNESMRKQKLRLRYTNRKMPEQKVLWGCYVLDFSDKNLEKNTTCQSV